MSMEEEGTDSGDGAAMLQGDRPEASDMLAVGLLIFIHQAQGAGKGIGKRNALGGESFGESLRQKVENVSAPGELPAISASLAGGKQLALPFGDIGLNLVTQRLRRELSRAGLHVRQLEHG